MYDKEAERIAKYFAGREKMQLVALTRDFKRKTLTADTLFAKTEDRVHPEALNNFGVKVYKGLEGINQDKSFARKIFAHAHTRGSVWAIFNLALCLINDEPQALNEAYRLFSLLLPGVRPSNYDFQHHDPMIYYFSGLHYCNNHLYEKAHECFNKVPENSRHYPLAQIKLKETAEFLLDPPTVSKKKCCNCILF
ncbi:MAG TPA: hypothetical protein VGV92_07660 [Gammaproteobacteria bacterium]|nr:hypothetical protein [Gammaproteobacteria bacterium]